jgi:hypothetical protein
MSAAVLTWTSVWHFLRDIVNVHFALITDSDAISLEDVSNENLCCNPSDAVDILKMVFEDTTVVIRTLDATVCAELRSVF